MKLSTFIVILLLIAGAIGIQKMFQNRVEKLAASENSPVNPTPSPTPRVWKRSELTVVHGRIVSVAREHLVVQCTSGSHEYDAGLASLVTARTSVEESARLIALGKQQERTDYGMLTEMVNGRLVASTRRIKTAASGRVSLAGHPSPFSLTAGQGINVVAAPLGGSYTLAYKLAPETRGAWMWEDRVNPLDRKPFQ